MKMKLPRRSKTPHDVSSRVDHPLGRSGTPPPGIVPQTDPSFRAGWNGAGNNDAGNGGAGGLGQAQITQCLRSYSDDLSAAIDCGMIEVIKGCHQAGDPHITINGKATKKMSKKCQENMYAGSNSIHIPCGGC